MSQATAIQQYQNIDVHSKLADAAPHQLVAMLFEGALDRLASARGAAEHGNTQLKGRQLTGALAIIDSLRASLDHEQGGEIAESLEALYDYMEGRLLEANSSSDISIIEEVSALLQEVKLGWDAIPTDLRNV